MAFDGGGLLDFLKSFDPAVRLDNGGDAVKLPDATGDNNVVKPGQVMQPKDPNVIYDDSGKAVDYSTGNPFKNLLNKPAEQGTLRNFLQRVIPGQNPVDVGSAISTEMGPASKNLDTATISPTSMANQQQAALQPKKNYALPSAIPPDAIPQLRTSLLTGAGLNPELYKDTDTANTIAGRMNSPNSKADMQQQQQEMQDISQQFRGAGVHGPVERAKPPQIGSNTVKKGDRQS